MNINASLIDSQNLSHPFNSNPILGSPQPAGEWKDRDFNVNPSFCQLRKVRRIVGDVFIALAAFGASSVGAIFAGISIVVIVSSTIWIAAISAIAILSLFTIACVGLSIACSLKKDFWNDPAFLKEKSKMLWNIIKQQKLSYQDIQQRMNDLNIPAERRTRILTPNDYNELFRMEAYNSNRAAFINVHGENVIDILDEENKNYLSKNDSGEDGKIKFENEIKNIKLEQLLDLYPIEMIKNWAPESKKFNQMILDFYINNPELTYSNNNPYILKMSKFDLTPPFLKGEFEIFKKNHDEILMKYMTKKDGLSHIRNESLMKADQTKAESLKSRDFKKVNRRFKKIKLQYNSLEPKYLLTSNRRIELIELVNKGKEAESEIKSHSEANEHLAKELESLKNPSEGVLAAEINLHSKIDNIDRQLHSTAIANTEDFEKVLSHFSKLQKEKGKLKSTLEKRELRINNYEQQMTKNSELISEFIAIKGKLNKHLTELKEIEELYNLQKEEYDKTKQMLEHEDKNQQEAIKNIEMEYDKNVLEINQEWNKALNESEIELSEIIEKFNLTILNKLNSFNTPCST